MSHLLDILDNEIQNKSSQSSNLEDDEFELEFEAASSQIFNLGQPTKQNKQSQENVKKPINNNPMNNNHVNQKSEPDKSKDVQPCFKISEDQKVKDDFDDDFDYNDDNAESKQPEVKTQQVTSKQVKAKPLIDFKKNLPSKDET